MVPADPREDRTFQWRIHGALCGLCCTIGVDEGRALQLGGGAATSNSRRGSSQENHFSYSLLSAGYLGMVCTLSIVPSEVEMLARNPRELLLEPLVMLVPIPSSLRAPTIVEVPVLHVEAESSHRVLPREEMPEEVEQLSSHEELLSEIEK